VSHDRYLVDALATQIWEIDPDESQMTTFNGTYSQMKEEREKEAAQQSAQQVEKADTRSSNIDARRARSRETKEERRRIARLQELENKISELESTLANLGTQLESPFVNPDEVRKIGTEYERVQREMDDRLSEWERLQI
jgi:ATP-binding cassette subfamily F protein 3